MDAERRAEIRRWAEGLERSEVAEIRAAGRALTMLVQENEGSPVGAPRAARADRGAARSGNPPAASTRAA